TSDTTVGSTASLTSDDSRKIFDLVDSLSSYGINNYLDLPQIIVCGDQSSGKSSVLEAISRVPFAASDGLCTRFATEIVLRRQEEAGFRASVIRSNGTDFDVTVEESSSSLTNNMASIMDTVQREHMGLSDSNAFSNDVLRIEISGPDQPHLTLVDLPGLFQAATADQSAEDAQMVKEMVVSYMKKPRSIILAVVSAANEFPLQQVTQRAREIDPTGTRTLGKFIPSDIHIGTLTTTPHLLRLPNVLDDAGAATNADYAAAYIGLITKPDKLDENSNTEKFYLNLCKNKEVHLALGWHVLRNRRLNEQHADSATRDRKEAGFFTEVPWNALPASQLGVEALKSRLSRVLYDHILGHIPTVMKEIQSSLAECKTKLEQLGQSRENLQEQRSYLIDVSQRFTNILRDSLKGDYSDNFFKDTGVSNCLEDRPLRAVIRTKLPDFSKDMHDRGCAQKIVADGVDINDDEDSSGTKRMSRSAYVDQVMEMIKARRGCELPGTFNPMTVGDLFKSQIAPWHQLTGYTAWTITDDARVVVNDVLAMLSQLLLPLQRYHPMTQNHYLTENMQKARAQRREASIRQTVVEFLGTDDIYPHFGHPSFKVERLIESLVRVDQSTEQDMDKYAATLAVDTVEAYYKLALKKFVDDFEVNAVEVCLMQKLPDIFSPTVIASLSDKTIKDIAEESQDRIQERHKLQEQIAALSKGEELMLQFGTTANAGA
ncbi:P-loop containing nucleoside triphosphate hydrolase protein, partial [Apiospora marii]